MLLARSCWCGALLLFFYDCLRIFRNVIPHRPWAAALEDLLFGTGSGIWLCVQVFRANSGALRDISWWEWCWEIDIRIARSAAFLWKN